MATLLLVGGFQVDFIPRRIFIESSFFLAADGSGERAVLGSSIAGGGVTLSTPELKPGFCYRISTGAAVPPGADAVVQVEDTVLLSKTPVRNCQ